MIFFTESKFKLEMRQFDYRRSLENKSSNSETQFRFRQTDQQKLTFIGNYFNHRRAADWHHRASYRAALFSNHLEPIQLGEITPPKV